MRIDLVVTRHPGLVEYLIQEGVIDDSTEVISHASTEEVTGKNVLGVLPHSLSCLAESFTEIPLCLTPEMRGRELTATDVRLIAESPTTYKVTRL